MLQRKQSIWLFLAALLNSGVFFFDLYKTHPTGSPDITIPLRVGDHYPSLLVALVMTIVPLVTIFLFTNRRLQIRLSLAAILAVIVFIALLLTRVTMLANLTPPPVNGTYWIGAVLPVLAFVFLLMAIGGIRRDEKLVKSVDRLR